MQNLTVPERFQSLTFPKSLSTVTCLETSLLGMIIRFTYSYLWLYFIFTQSLSTLVRNSCVAMKRKEVMTPVWERKHESRHTSRVWVIMENLIFGLKISHEGKHVFSLFWLQCEFRRKLQVCLTLGAKVSLASSSLASLCSICFRLYFLFCKVFTELWYYQEKYNYVLVMADRSETYRGSVIFPWQVGDRAKIQHWTEGQPRCGCHSSVFWETPESSVHCDDLLDFY